MASQYSLLRVTCKKNNEIIHVGQEAKGGKGGKNVGKGEKGGKRGNKRGKAGKGGKKLAKKKRVVFLAAMLPGRAVVGFMARGTHRLHGKQCWWAVLLYFTNIFAAMLPGRQSCHVSVADFLVGLRRFADVAAVLDRGRLRLQLLCAVYLCFQKPNLSRPSHLTNQCT